LPARVWDRGMSVSLKQRIKRSAAYQQYKHSVAHVTLKEWEKALVRRIRLPKYRGDAYCCPICRVNLRAFKPLSPRYEELTTSNGYYPLSQVETFNYRNYYCPACDASDRERLYAIYLDAAFARFDRARRYRVVEFAPSLALQKKIKSYPFVDYRSADLFRHTVDDRIDICDMHVYADNSVDVVLCSHVLEHVPDDRKAMREIFRILRPGGFAIVMVPLVHGVEETCEVETNTPEERWKLFGADDHVRQYGKRDFADRLTATGFRLERLGAGHFGAETFRRAGIADDSVLYVVWKDRPA
jgi:SAM-dependent methyltransferase